MNSAQAQDQPLHQKYKNLWDRPQIKWFAYGILAIIVLGFLFWWFFYRGYVTTNDSRVATNILRIMPVGVGGVIEKVNVEEGDFVKAGQLLVEIDHSVPEAQYNKAKARYHLAQLELDRAKDLAKKNVSAARDLDSAQTNFELAEADFKLAETNLNNTYLKAPIDGLVIQKLAQPGNVIDPGQVAIVISDVDHAWVEANIEETSSAKLKIGQPVTITIDEGGTLTGHVQEITAATASQFSLLPTENASGNFTKVVQKIPIKVALDPHPGRILKAGQSVTIKILVR
jgi:membrane fusion protein (multidrug efflux system)